MPTQRQIEIQARQDEALRLREAGFSWDHIARSCGFINPNGRPSRSGATRGAERARLRRAINGTSILASTTNGVTTGARQFGLEIEFNGVLGTTVISALTAAGINVRAENYNHSTRNHWKLIYDVSVRSTGTGGSSGHELVSPPLSGEEGERQVRVVLETLRSIGARVDTSCGVHVHHDANDLSGDTIARFIGIYVNRQAEIDQLVSRSRRASTGRANRYADRWTMNELIAIQRDFRTYGRVVSNVSRYKTINVQSYSKYGTIEIRQHQGTLNTTKVLAWIAMGQAMIEAAKSQDVLFIEEQTTCTLNQLLDELQNHGLPANFATSLNRRAAALNS